MDFDTYWKQLVERVHHQHETLTGDEALFYRLSCIYGETMVDGVEAYFERRFPEFDEDMKALVTCGFDEMAADFRHARRVMFAESPLDEETVERVISRLLEEDEEVMPILEEVNAIYTRLVTRLDAVAEYRHRFGLEKGLYTEVG